MISWSDAKSTASIICCVGFKLHRAYTSIKSAQESNEKYTHRTPFLILVNDLLRDGGVFKRSSLAQQSNPPSAGHVHQL